MDITASREVSNLLLVLTGEPFPSASETRLRQRGDGYDRLADDLAGAEDMLRAAVQNVRRNASGPSIDEFARSMEVYLSRFPGYLPTASQAAREAGENHKQLALEVEYAKIMTIGAAVEVLLQLLIAAAIAWLDPSAPAKAMALGQAIMRLLSSSLLLRVLNAVLISVVTEAIMEVLLDLIAQRVQIDRGSRKNFDLELLRMSAAGGAIGGLAALGPDAIMGAFKKVLKGLNPPSAVDAPDLPANTPPTTGRGRPDPTPDPPVRPSPTPAPSTRPDSPTNPARSDTTPGKGNTPVRKGAEIAETVASGISAEFAAELAVSGILYGSLSVGGAGALALSALVGIGAEAGGEALGNRLNEYLPPSWSQRNTDGTGGNGTGTSGNGTGAGGGAGKDDTARGGPSRTATTPDGPRPVSLDGGSPEPSRTGSHPPNPTGPEKTATAGPEKTTTGGPADATTGRPEKAETSGPERAETSGQTKAETSGQTKAETSGQTKAETGSQTKAESGGQGRAEAGGPDRAETGDPAGTQRGQAVEATSSPAHTTASSSETTVGFDSVNGPDPAGLDTLDQVLSEGGAPHLANGSQNANPLGAWATGDRDLTPSTVDGLVPVSPIPIYSDSAIAARYPWLAGVNPRRGEDDGFRTNCLLAAIATDMSLDTGDPHRIGPSDIAPEQYLVNYAGDRPLQQVDDYASVEGALGSAPVGARGIMLVNTDKAGRSHAYTVVKTPDGVLVLDGYEGKQAVLPSQPRRVRFVSTGDVDIQVPGGRPVPPEAELVGGTGDDLKKDFGKLIKQGESSKQATTSKARSSNAVPVDGGSRRVRVRGDGMCLLYSTILSAPLAVAGLGLGPAYDRWLRDIPRRVAAGEGREIGRSAEIRLVADVLRERLYNVVVLDPTLGDVAIRGDRAMRGHDDPDTYQPNAMDYSRLLDIVENWSTNWNTNMGDGLSILVANALGLRLVIGSNTNPTGGQYSYARVQDRGVDALRLWYSGGSHYDAWPRTAPPVAPATLVTAWLGSDRMDDWQYLFAVHGEALRTNEVRDLLSRSGDARVPIMLALLDERFAGREDVPLRYVFAESSAQGLDQVLAEVVADDDLVAAMRWLMRAADTDGTRTGLDANLLRATWLAASGRVEDARHAVQAARPMLTRERLAPWEARLRGLDLRPDSTGATIEAGHWVAEELTRPPGLYDVGDVEDAPHWRAFAGAVVARGRRMFLVNSIARDDLAQLRAALRPGDILLAQGRHPAIEEIVRDHRVAVIRPDAGPPYDVHFVDGGMHARSGWQVAVPGGAGRSLGPAPTLDRTAIEDALDLMEQSDSESSGDETPTPPESPTPPDPPEPAAPWYLDAGALGEMSVARVSRLSGDEADRTVEALLERLPSPRRHRADPDIEMGELRPLRADLGAVEQEQEIRAAVSREIKSLLTPVESDPDGHKFHERWEDAFFYGVTVSAGDRLIWVRPVPTNLKPFAGPDPGGPREYSVSFGSTKVSRDTSESSAKHYGGGVEETFNLSTGRASRLISGLPMLSASGEYAREQSAEARVIWGRKLFVDQSTRFTSDVSFEIFVDGEEWGRPTAGTYAPLVDITLPSRYAKAGPGPDEHAPPAPPAGGPAHEASQARQALNAIDLTPVITAWHRELSRVLPAGIAASIASTGTRQLLNERTTRNRSGWLLSSGDMTDSIRHGSGLSRFSGYLTTSVAIRELQLVEVTKDVPVRDDLGVIASSSVARSDLTAAGIAGYANVLGMTHAPSTGQNAEEESSDKVTGALMGGLGIESERESGLKVGGKVLNHTVLVRKTNQARYRVAFDFTLTTHGNHRIAPVTRRVVAELGVPESEAPRFEHSVHGAAFTPALVAPGRPRPTAHIAAPGPVTPPPPPSSAADVEAVLRPRVPGAPQARRRYRPLGGPAEREPLALAMRRGQGLGIASNKPGSENVANLVLSVLEQKSGQADLGAEVRRDVLARVGRAALEADPSRIEAGKKFTVKAGGRRFEVLVTEHRMELLDSDTYPMSVNGRTLIGSSTAGSQSSEVSIGGRTGGGPAFPFGGDAGPDEDVVHSGRLYAPRARVEVKGSRGSEQEIKQEVKEYRRTETTGDVDAYRYHTVYEVAIRELRDGGNHGARETWLVGADLNEGVTTEVAVPVEHRPRHPRTGDERPFTARDVARAERVTVSRFPTEAWAPTGGPAHLPLDTEGTAGLYPSFRHIPELPAAAARLYQQLNNLDEAWFDEPMNWPDELFDLGAGTELSGQFPSMVDEFGWDLQLPDRDGAEQVIRVRARLFREGVAYQYSGDNVDSEGGIELEQYRQSAVSHGRSTEWDVGVGGKGGIGGLYLNSTTDGTEQHERGRLGATGYGSAGLSFGGSGGADYGAIDITRATYGDNVHAYRARVVFELTAISTRDGQSARSGPIYIAADHATDLLVTDRAAEDLRLVRPVAPPDPAASRQIIDPELLAAVGHPERLTAGVLREILDRLQARGVPVPGHLRRALINRFAARNLEAQFLALSGQGVYGWFPVPGPFGTTQYLWVRVTADVHPAPTDDRPRDKVSLTLRGETHDAESNSSSSGWEWGGAFQFHGRGTWTHDGDTLGGLGHRDYESSHGAEHGTQKESKDIFRAGPKKSHEITHDVDFVIELALSTEMPQAVKLAFDLVRETAFGLAWLADTMWPGAQRSTMEHWYDNAPFDWQERDTADGEVRLIVPQYLTRPAGERPGTWQEPGAAVLAPAPAPVPPGRPLPRWEAPAANRPALNTALIQDHSLHPWRMARVAREFERWAALAGQGTRVSHARDLAAHEAWRVPGVTPGSPLHLAVAHFASEMMLRSHLRQLLQHRYQIPGTGITLGLDIRRERTYVDDRGRALGHEQKARSYQQEEKGPINKSDSSSGWDWSLGPQGGTKASIKKIGYYGEGAGRGSESGTGHSAEMSEVNERNREGKPTLYQYRYDVTLVITGPHGTLLIDVDAGLHLMRDAVPDLPDPIPTPPTSPSVTSASSPEPSPILLPHMPEGSPPPTFAPLPEDSPPPVFVPLSQAPTPSPPYLTPPSTPPLATVIPPRTPSPEPLPKPVDKLNPQPPGAWPESEEDSPV